MKKIVLDPVTRVEGHLRIDTEVENGRVTKAWSKGEMFRGIEAVLVGRDPLDAPTITQRMCGVCPVSHGIASTRAIESALGIVPADNGRLLRNLMLGANFLQSHILHFYQLSALDFLKVDSILAYAGKDHDLAALKRWVEGEVASNRVLPAAPFLPQLKGAYGKAGDWTYLAIDNYLESLNVRQETHKMAAIFAGKIPHPATLVPGGVTCGVELAAVEKYRSLLKRVRVFVENGYLQDVSRVARRFTEYRDQGRGVGRFLTYGAFEEGTDVWLPAGVFDGRSIQPLDTGQISEEIGHSYYDPATTTSALNPNAAKEKAYSWIKAPRYAGKTMEVGPLARLMVARSLDHPAGKAMMDVAREAGVAADKLNSTIGRHLARCVECLILTQQMEVWLDALDHSRPSVTPYRAQASGRGHAIVEAPRGALGHWIEIDNHKVTGYQAIVPSTWNFSPRGDARDPGPVETALENTLVGQGSTGLEVARVVRAFDPCIACAVH
jgi:ferredoxin hydrogenase large subunit/hydrogenase large subunit